MTWIVVGLMFLIGLLLAIFSSLPIAIGFLLIDLIGMHFVMGPDYGDLAIRSIFSSLTNPELTPVPMFVLMGEFLFNSGVAIKALNTMELWLGKLPGRLSVLSIVSGALFASLSGSTIANTAMLGSLLTPNMLERKYDKAMIAGPIVASGSLAMMIPPSSLTVVFGSIAGISIGGLLVGGFLPGLLTAFLYIIYTVYRCWRNPKLAPVYEVEKHESSEILLQTLKNVLPLGLIVLATVGVIFFGIATPTDAAAIGTMVSLVLAIALGNFNWEVLRKSAVSAVRVTAMILIIVSASTAFSQVLAFSGVTTHLLSALSTMPLTPFWLLIGMLFIVFILGMFMEEISIMMITLPIFMPLVHTANIDPIWFGILTLLVLEISMLTPPVGVLLYTMKGVVPKEISMMDIWKAAAPYVVCGLVSVVAILAFPGIATALAGG